MPAPKGHQLYPGGDTGGRPCRYSKEDIEAYAGQLKAWLTDPAHIWFKDFCLDNDIDPDLMAEWAKENETFNGVYKLAKHRQESRLVNGGLTNRLNSSIVKLVLSNIHSWERDQSNVDNSEYMQAFRSLMELMGQRQSEATDKRTESS